MVEYKIVLADPKTGKCYQREVKEAEAEVFLGKQIGNKVKGDSFNLSGYEFEITGGSDSSGFPMRGDIEGAGRKRILVIKGIGAKKKRKGQRQRKTVRGNTIGQETNQINMKILKYGKAKLDAGETKPTEEKAEKKEDKKEKKSEEDKPAEEKKEENKEEGKSGEDKPDEKKSEGDSKKEDKEEKSSEKSEEK